MSSILGCEYQSEVTADHGFEFQDELLLHLCLRMTELNVESFSVGLEVKEFPKFDDVVVEFVLSGNRKCLIFIQTKHIIEQTRKIFPEHLCSIGECVKSSRDLWKNFNLQKYIKAVMNESFQDKLHSAEDYQLRYIILTNLAFVNDKESTDEENNDLEGLFERLTNRGAQILRFNSKCREEIQAIIDNITGDSKEKQQKLTDMGLDYFLDRLRLVVRSPNLSNLAEINDKILCKSFKVFNRESFAKVFRKNLIEFTAIDKSKRRRTLDKTNLQRIISRSVVEVDFPTISKSFIDELPNWIHFRVPVMKNLQAVLMKCNKICNKIGQILVLLKVYEALKLTNPNVLVIPHSKITEIHIEALKMYGKNIILYLDDDGKEFPAEISENANVFFIGKDLELKLRYRYDELTEKCRNRLMQIQLQGVKIKIPYDVAWQDDPNYTLLIDEVLTRSVNNQDISLGRNLPRDKIPAFYIEKFPFTSAQLDELISEDRRQVRLMICPTIVIGGPGFGKSCGLQRAAMYLKEKFPTYWMEFIDLKLFSKAFFERKSVVFTESEAVDFFMDNLVSYSPENVNLERRMLNLYFKSEYPRIFIAFDGFDEISPTYEILVLNLIKTLSQKNIACFLTSRLHCEKVLAELRELKHRFKVMRMESFNMEEIERFTEEFWRWKLPDCGVESIKYFQQQFFAHNALFKGIAETPMFLLMLAKIATPFCESVCKATETNSDGELADFDDINLWTIYERIFEMSFDHFYNKEGIDSTSNLAMVKRKQDMEVVRKIHTYLAVKELQMSDMISIEADVSNDVEILARGFVSRTDDGEFFFVHRTYAEYFFARCLVDEMKKYNETVMKYLTMNLPSIPSSLILEFVCGLVLKEILGNPRFIERKMILSADSEMLTHFSIFFQTLLFFVWRHFMSDIYADKILLVNEFINSILQDSNLRHFEFSLYYKYLDDRYIYIITQQLIFLVAHPMIFFGEDVKRTSLRSLDRFLGRKVSGSDCEFLEQFYESLVNNELLTKEEMIEEYEIVLRKFLTTTYHRSNLFFSYFKLKCINYDEELNYVKDLLRKNHCFQEFDTNYILHVALMEEINNDSSNFLDKLTVFIRQEDRVYQLLAPFELDNKCRKDFVERIVKAFYRKNCNFICNKNNSILYYLWKNDKYFLMQDILTYLKDEDFGELLESPHFDGKSFVEYFETAENGDYVNEAFIMHVFRTYKIDVVLELVSPCSDENIHQVIRRNLNLCLTLGNQITAEEEKQCPIEQLLRRIMNDIFEWKMKKGHKILFLHTILSTDFKYGCRNAHEVVFKWLLQTQKMQVCYSELTDVNDEGNSPLHIAASRKVLSFFEHLFRLFDDGDQEKLLNLMYIRNKKRQNFLHCFPETEKTEDIEFIVKFYVKIKDRILGSKASHLEKLLFQQDANGMTPFHEKSFSFFTKFIHFIALDRRDELLEIKDNQDRMLSQRFRKMRKEDLERTNAL